MRARHVLKDGERLFCSLSWAEELASPADVDDAAARIDDDRALLAQLGRSRARARPPVARADPALGARDQGPDLHADRRDRRRAHHLAAGDPGRRAQLGLPLHVDPRLDVHAAGAALAEPRLGGRRVHAVHRRPRAQRRRLAADHVRHRRSPRPHRDDARRPLGLRRARGPVRIGNGAFDQRQNDVYGAALDSILLHTRRSQRLPRRLWPIVRRAGRGRDPRLARARPGDLGGARRAAALRVVEAHVLGGDGPGRQARRDPRRRRARRQLARHGARRSRRTSSSTASTPAACCASTTRPTRSTPRRCSPPSSASCRATTSGCARACSRSPTS